MILDKIQMLLPFVHDILERTENNERLALYMNQLNTGRQLDEVEDISDRAALRLLDCGQNTFEDTYADQRVKDYQGMMMCGNRFCLNCQKLRQLTRLKRFGPELDTLGELYDLCHVTLTVPNCSSTKLIETINQMAKSFKFMVRYFSGNKKIRGIDFKQYGYVGSLRSLEVTYKRVLRDKGQEYHPHFHCIFAFEKGLVLDKHLKNAFSMSRRGERAFSDLEILIQKIWYLRNTGNRVTSTAIKNVPEGYSCTIDKIEECSYYEVFKYATKGYDENSAFMEYEQFKTLWHALRRRRTIQGYGELYRLQPDDDIDESFDKAYDAVEAALKLVEHPIRTSTTLEQLQKDLASDAPPYIFINRKTIHNLENEDRQLIIDESSSQERLAKALKRLERKRAAQKINTREMQLRWITKEYSG